jgi:hypothetical protein
VPPSIISARLIAIFPLSSIRFEMKEMTKQTARVKNSMDLKRSVFPVRSIKKNKMLKKTKVATRANRRPLSVGIFPLLIITKVRSIIGRERRNALNRLRLAGTD